MVMIGLAVYVAITLAFGVSTLTGVAPGARADELMDGYDRTLLAAVAVVSSIAWPVLLPVYATGWMGSPDARRVYHALGTRWSRVREWTRRFHGLRGTAH